MSCEGKIYVGQIGLLLEVDTQGLEDGCPIVDWSGATTSDIICLLPNKTEVTFKATIDDNLLQYTTTSKDDLPLPGTYKIQAHLVGTNYDVLGESDTFKVYDKWK